MLDRIARGSIPPKHHLAHRSADGALYREQCLTRKGFDGAYTVSYHENRPQTQRPAELGHGFRLPRVTEPRPLRKRHYLSGDLKAQFSGGPPIDARVPLVFNDDVTISGIPLRAHDWRLGSRSAVDWVVDQWRYRTHESGIDNDPNAWPEFEADPAFLVTLLQRVVAVSMETLDLIDSLPEPAF